MKLLVNHDLEVGVKVVQKWTHDWTLDKVVVDHGHLHLIEQTICARENQPICEIRQRLESGDLRPSWRPMNPNDQIEIYEVLVAKMKAEQW